MYNRCNYFNLNFYILYFNNLFLTFIYKGGIQRRNKITRGLSCIGVEYDNKSSDASKYNNTKLSVRIKKMILKIVEEQNV